MPKSQSQRTFLTVFAFVPRYTCCTCWKYLLYVLAGVFRVRQQVCGNTCKEAPYSRRGFQNDDVQMYSCARATRHVLQHRALKCTSSRGMTSIAKHQINMKQTRALFLQARALRLCMHHNVFFTLQLKRFDCDL
jgi:hypothetical protein